MKNLTFAAAIAAALTAALPAAALTDNLGAQRAVADAGHVELDRVTSATGGYVEILDGSSIETGVLLGSEDVRAGLETDVRVQLIHRPYRDNVIAVLYDADGQVTATRELRVQN
ncbi:MAG: DUF7282 domain-containing protein [Limimaricola soesokkakensis]|uniref:DUF7282 domain-containing protein n=1 Tax=Limimaricola soesokkakensis TaxID=1343159 RepID=A0A1X6ZUR0_9RHOB|nr:hypothetical protein [Limimaricola soesokkakensis]PSK82967.1 hypothetical protein CLV79_11185 [Limimaricola soesokkakensis]SLN61645.1 hypothetical protein LOS8367_02982 [Limimaricola soesokkakensis]